MPLMVVVGTINRYPAPADGWEVLHVDRSARGMWDPALAKCVPIDIVADMRNLHLDAGSVDRIQSWHALEHVNQDGGRQTLREFARVLKPDGVLDLRVPDLEFVQRAQDITTVMNLIYGDQTQMADEGLNAHKWGYTERTLRELLSAHGFTANRVDAEYPDEIQLIATLCN
jgi:predicted SAM-dependent methyltransferase